MGLLRAYDWARCFSKNKTILEIGCGDLEGGELLLKKVKVKRYCAIDYNMDAINLGIKRRINAIILCSKGEELPFKDKTFNIVLSFQVLEHILEYEKFLKEINRVIKNNGVLLLSTPDSLFKEDKSPYHISMFDGDSLKQLLENYFEHVDMSYHYGADRFILRDLTAAGINMPNEYIQAVNIGYEIGQISRKNKIVNWMISSGRKGHLFKYLPSFLVNHIFKAYTGYDFHWFEFKHISLINDYPFPCLSFFCVCKDPKP